MKIRSAVISSSVGFAFLAAGCGCSETPETATTAEAKTPTAKPQAAAQRMVNAVPLVTPQFPPQKEPPPPQYMTEGPAPPKNQSFPSDGLQPPPAYSTLSPMQKAAPPRTDQRAPGFTVGSKRTTRTGRVQSYGYSTINGPGGMPSTSKMANSASNNIIGPS